MTNYFCHKCNRPCTVSSREGGEVRCDRCNDSFVEELPQNTGSEATTPDGSPVVLPVGGDNPFQMFPTSPFSQLFQQMRQRAQGPEDPTQQPSNSRNFPSASTRGRGGGMPSSGPTRSSSTSGANREQQQHAHAEGDDPMANFLQHLFTNIMAQGQQGAEEAGPQSGSFIIRFGQGNTDPAQPGGSRGGAFRFHGNLGDYAWGPNGLDNILTTLLNQFTEAEERARSLRPEDINRLPMVKVSQKHVDNGTQCTTCMETFSLDEEVARLDCAHIFHRACIEPWLQRNDTCPICREKIDPTNWGPPKVDPRITDVDELD